MIGLRQEWRYSTVETTPTSGMGGKWAFPTRIAKLI